jgi:hypothetical protein
MVMENKHIVDGDGVGDDGDEETLETPPLRSGEQVCAAPENEDRDGGGALILVKFRPPGNRVFMGI